MRQNFVTPTRAIAVLVIAASIGLAITMAFQNRDTPVAAEASTVIGDRVDTIFLPLSRERIAVPVERQGSGGALTEWAGNLVLMTHEGRFFSIADSVAQELDLEPPANHYDAYLEYISTIDGLNPAGYYFRYNDVLITDGLLVVSYSRWDPVEHCVSNAIATSPTLTTPGEIEGGWTNVFVTEPCLPIAKSGVALQAHMAGGRMVALGQKRIAMASGDYAFDGNYNSPAISQRDDYQYGKVLEIDLATGEARQLSRGHSNMQGISTDRNGDIWIVEHGRRGGDELNRIVEGADYGWPVTSLGTRYNRLPLPNTTTYGQHDQNFESPVYAWLPSAAVSSLTLIEGFDPSWDGDFLAGSLSGQSLFRIRIRDNRVLFAEKIPMDVRIRYVQQMTDGRLALWTDQRFVEILSVGTADHSYEFTMARIDTLDLDPPTAEAIKLAIDTCSECHSFGITNAAAAPALGTVFGRPVASNGWNGYSASLAGNGGTWNAESLRRFIDDPEAFAPGTTMPDPALDDEKVLTGLVTLLQAIKEEPE